MTRALVIGAGPAGLMAADMLSAAGVSVMVAEARPSPARKLLMAGKSGLNLTKDAPFETFLAAYEEAAPHLRPMLQAFGPNDVRRWAEALGQEMFTGSSGRVFPRAMKASPLLRAWLGRLAARGVAASGVAFGARVEAALDDLARQQDRVLERLERHNVQGACGPKLNPEETNEAWLARPGAPKPKLADEKPVGKTVPYDQLIEAWRAGRAR